MSDRDPPSTESDARESPIEVLAEQPPDGVDLGALSDWVRRVASDVVPEMSSFVVRLSDAVTMQEINRRFRDQDRPTDVLSFPGDETPEGHHLGDVIIAVPIAEQQSDQAGHSLETELKVLILHGLLHCLGYDHETDEGEMAARELELRRRWIEADA